jgi:anthranilate phosphoribosyltransferase
VTEDILAVWRGEAGGVALATVLATLSLALLALSPAATPAEADARAAEIWRRRGAG